jgi:RNA polymerase-binding transcription factor DksA
LPEREVATATKEVSMSPDDARERVQAEQSRVGELARHLREEIDDETDGEQSELSGYAQHPADSGSETFEREKDLSILEQLEAELAELQAALERIDAGTYGIDEVTGEPIAPERLQAMPAARTNVDTGHRREESG